MEMVSTVFKVLGVGFIATLVGELLVQGEPRVVTNQRSRQSLRPVN